MYRKFEQTEKSSLSSTSTSSGGFKKSTTNQNGNNNFGARHSHITLIAMLSDCERWSKYKSDKLDMLFDVFAMIDSNVEWNHFGGFEFLLRDQSGYAKITYYEIDSSLPKLKRGDWVRIGATMRPWGLQATSIEMTNPAAFLHGLRDKMVDSRLALKRRLEEIGIKNPVL